jgi:hypothetical protein
MPPASRPELPPVVLWRRAVLAAPELKYTAKLVAFALDAHMDGNGRGCRPGISLLAKEAALDRRTVQRSLRELEAAGWVISAKGGRGRRSTSSYRPSWPEPVRAAGLPPLQGEQGRHVRPVRAADEARKGGSPAARGRQEDAREDVSTARRRAEHKQHPADASRQKREAYEAAGREWAEELDRRWAEEEASR